MNKTQYTLKPDYDMKNIGTTGKLAAQLLRELAAYTKDGITGLDLDNYVKDWTKKNRCQSSVFGYKKFPGQLCVSINEEIVHGVPNARRINNGDLVSLDLVLVYNKWHADTATTVAVGEISDQNKKLLEVSLLSLNNAIVAAVAGNHLGDISHAMQTTVEAGGYKVMRQYGGHGIGRQIHEPPFIACYGEPGSGVQLEHGMVLAIETMVLTGDGIIDHKPDGTVISKDGTVSAHFEHTIAIRTKNTEILTV